LLQNLSQVPLSPSSGLMLLGYRDRNGDTFRPFIWITILRLAGRQHIDYFWSVELQSS
jgi:hypothetical protein